MGAAESGGIDGRAREVTVERVPAPPGADIVGALAALLRATVASNASVGFDAVPDEAAASAWWRDWLSGPRVVLAARDGADVVGTATLVLPTLPSHRNRADVAKLMVHPRVRRRGLARRLMAALEAQARAAGRYLLVLDTETDSAAEALYRGLGWTRAGVIPDYAYRPDGVLCATSVYYRRLG